MKYRKSGVYKLLALTGELAEQWPAIARYGETVCKVLGKWQGGLWLVRVGREEACLPATCIGQWLGRDRKLGPMQVVCLRTLATAGSKGCGWETISRDRKAAGGSTNGMAIGPCLMKLGDWPLTLAMQPKRVQRECRAKVLPYFAGAYQDENGKPTDGWKRHYEKQAKLYREAREKRDRHPQAVRGLGYITRKRIAHPKLPGRTCYWYAITELGRAVLADA